MISLNEGNFNTIEKQPLSLVYFWASWCGPCLDYSTILEQFEKDFPNIVVSKVNVEENQELTRKYSIIVVPTLTFFKKGKPVKTMIGTQVKDHLYEIAKVI
jgi:thioredoxin 1